MRRLVPFALAFTTLASSWMAACGSSADAPSGGDVDGNGANGAGASGNGTGGGSLGSGSSNGQAGGNGTGAVGSWEGEGCADGSAGGNLAPVYLVFLVDQSGSMGDNCTDDNYSTRWEPMVSALNTFFADEDSANLYASLTLFPTDEEPGTECGSEGDLKCDAGSYDSPVVEPTELPNATVFAEMLDRYPNEYGTPTYPALTGTVTYAKTLKDEGKKVAIVMVTDGQPAFCDGNSVDSTAGAAADGLVAGIPTYVLGVGDSITDLNQIAEEGGTTEATIINGATPEETQQALLDKINEIRGQQISCEMTIPEPPEGQTLDPLKINVEYSAGGETKRLLMNEDCADGSGWHYDDLSNPTKITLCSDTCDEVKAQPDAALNVVFGCEVAIIDPK
jgi:hypothetical protein